MNAIIQIYSSIKNDQKPIIQFIELKKIDFILSNFKRYTNFIVSLLIAIIWYTNNKSIEGIYLIAILNFSISLVSLLLWKTVLDNFAYSKLSYEESSWFDLKIWNKPMFLLKNDKFFVNNKIKRKIRNYWNYLRTVFILLGVIIPIFYFES